MPAFRIQLRRFRSVEFETEDLEHPPFSPFPSVEILRFGFLNRSKLRKGRSFALLTPTAFFIRVHRQFNSSSLNFHK